MANVPIAFSLVVALIAASAISIAKTGNKSDAIGKADRLEILSSSTTDFVVLEQREIGLSRLYLADKGEIGCDQSDNTVGS
jgi:hypothetical protein